MFTEEQRDLALILLKENGGNALATAHMIGGRPSSTTIKSWKERKQQNEATSTNRTNTCPQPPTHQQSSVAKDLKSPGPDGLKSPGPDDLASGHAGSNGLYVQDSQQVSDQPSGQAFDAEALVAEAIAQDVTKTEHSAFARYSQEDINIAIKAYLRNDKNATATVKELGYPRDGRILIRWVDAIMPGQARHKRRRKDCDASAHNQDAPQTVALPKKTSQNEAAPDAVFSVEDAFLLKTSYQESLIQQVKRIKTETLSIDHELDTVKQAEQIISKLIATHQEKIDELHQRQVQQQRETDAKVSALVDALGVLAQNLAQQDILDQLKLTTEKPAD